MELLTAVTGLQQWTETISDVKIDGSRFFTETISFHRLLVDMMKNKVENVTITGLNIKGKDIKTLKMITLLLMIVIQQTL